MTLLGAEFQPSRFGVMASGGLTLGPDPNV